MRVKKRAKKSDRKDQKDQIVFVRLSRDAVRRMDVVIRAAASVGIPRRVTRSDAVRQAVDEWLAKQSQETPKEVVRGQGQD